MKASQEKVLAVDKYEHILEQFEQEKAVFAEREAEANALEGAVEKTMRTLALDVPAPRGRRPLERKNSLTFEQPAFSSEEEAAAAAAQLAEEVNDNAEGVGARLLSIGSEE